MIEIPTGSGLIHYLDIGKSRDVFYYIDKSDKYGFSTLSARHTSAPQYEVNTKRSIIVIIIICQDKIGAGNPVKYIKKLAV